MAGPSNRLMLLWMAASVGCWFYLFDHWIGLWAGLLLCLPVGFLFSFLPVMLLGTLRQLPVRSDALLTWVFIGAGVALTLYAFIATSGTTLALLLLCGLGLIYAGITLFQLRFRAMLIRDQMGELDPENSRFLEQIDRARQG